MGNFGLPLDVGEFVSTFIQRMRRHTAIQSPPSLRQGTSVHQFLFARFIRTNHISAQDLLDVCVHTTFFEDQSVAYAIAHELLMSALNEKIVSLREVITYSSYEQLLTLKNFGADYLKRVDIIDKLLQADKEIFKDPLRMVEEIFDSIKENLTLDDLQFLNSRGILEEKMQEISDPAMKIYADALLERYGDLERRFRRLLEQHYPPQNSADHDLLKNQHPVEKEEKIQGVEEEIKKETTSQLEQKSHITNLPQQQPGLSNYAPTFKERNEKHPESNTEMQLNNEHMKKTTPGKILHNLDELQIEEQMLNNLLQKTLQSMENWGEFLDFLQDSGLKQAPPDHLLDNLTAEELFSTETKISRLKPEQQSEILKSLEKKWEKPQQRKSETPEETEKSSTNQKQNESLIKDRIEKITEQMLADFMLSPKTSIAQMQDHLTPDNMDSFANSLSRNQLKDLMAKIHSPPKQKPVTLEKKRLLEQFKQQMMKKLSSQMLKKTQNPKELGEQISEFIQNQIPFDKDAAKQTALDKGLDLNEWESLINAPHQTVKEMIHRNLEDMGAFTQKLRQYHPNARQTQEIIEEGIKMKNSSVLGAITQHSFDQTANFVAQKNDPNVNSLFFKGIRRASGGNLLRQWYRSRNRIDPRIKGHILEILQQMVVDQAVFMVKSQMGRVKQGVFPSNQDLRPYRPGDPMENISIEDTLNNLIEQGKTPQQIESSDLMCRKDRGNTLKVFLILDKSGSMEGNKFTIATYAVAILAYFLPKQDFSLVFFDSQHHNIKNFTDTTPIDSLVGSVLNCEAEGGTKMMQTIQFLRDSMENLDVNNRYLVLLFSDLALDDGPAEIIKQLEKIRRFHLNLHILNAENLDRKFLGIFKEFLGAESHLISAIESLPALFVNIFNRTFF